MSDQPSRAVALAQPHAALPSTSEFELIQRMARIFQASQLYRNIDSEAKIAVLVQTGRELGIPPAAALRSFSFIGGKPTASAEMLAALIYRDHGNNALKVLESSADRCTVEYRRRGWDAPGRVTFSMADADAAGLLKGDKHNANWDKYPRAMLRSRAISEAARTAFQDSILGMYTSEELAPEDVTITAAGELVYEHVATPALDTAPVNGGHTTGATVETAGGRTVDLVTGEIVNPVASVPSAAAPKTPAQTSGPMEPYSVPSGLTPFQQIELRIVQADTLALLQQVWKDVAGLYVKRAITEDERAALVVAKDRRKTHIDFVEKIAAAADTDTLSAIQADIDAACAFEQIDQPSAALLTELVNERGGQVSDPPAPPATNGAAAVDDLALVEL